MGLGAPIGVDYNATLVFNNSNSLYTYAKDSLEGGFINKSIIIKKDKDNIFVKPKRTSKNGYQVFLELNREMLSRNKGYSYVKEEIPKINWSITEDKKNIGNFECLKAVGTFRGREYTAWFTKSIPLAYGPWKLQGLPGLILEAYDINKEVYFYFKSIKYPLEQKTEIKKPNPKSENSEWITFKEYKELLISVYEKNIQNGRLVAEKYDGADTVENEMPMRNFFIEVFDE
jgi:GLPGLI family protein